MNLLILQLAEQLDLMGHVSSLHARMISLVLPV